MRVSKNELNWSLIIIQVFFVCVCLVYLFSFVFLPQSWSLNDDYGQIKDWAMNPNLHPLEVGWLWFKGRLTEGRFLPIDSFARLLRYKYFPLNPTFYRCGQIFLLSIALFSFFKFLKKMGLSSLQVIFGLFLCVICGSTSEWIILTASAETLAVPFFILALWSYSADRRWLAILFYTLAFLSKESFVVLGGAFLVLEYFKAGKKNWLPLGVMAILATGFSFVIFKLPRVYTGGSHFSQIPLIYFIYGIVIPPLKAFAPAILLVFVARVLSCRQRCKARWDLVVLAGAIIIPFSLFLTLWLPFNSFGYLQMILPFGWAILLAALLPFEELKYKAYPYLIFGVCLFGFFMVMRTTWNRWHFLDEGRAVVTMTCEDYRRDPHIQFYTNCEEPTNQLENYLLLYRPECPHPPHLKHIRSPEEVAAIHGSFEVVIGQKWCDSQGDEFKSLPVSTRLDFQMWSLVKGVRE